MTGPCLYSLAWPLRVRWHSRWCSQGPSCFGYVRCLVCERVCVCVSHSLCLLCAMHVLPCIHHSSSFYDISHNIMISGGCKNFLGNDKRWHGNLIVYPNTDDHGSCLTHWAGSMSYYGNNTCFSNSDWPIAMWQTTMGACEYDWRKADARSFLPMMDTNSYYTGSGRYWMGCNASYAFTLAQLNDLGIESGSTVRGALSVRGQLQVVDDYIAGIGWSQ